jgi:hypothetical protein
MACTGSCAWYWDGSKWMGPTSTCSKDCLGDCGHAPLLHPQKPGFVFTPCLATVKPARRGKFVCRIYYLPRYRPTLIPFPKMKPAKKKAVARKGAKA